MRQTKLHMIVSGMIVLWMASAPARAQYTDSMGYGGWNNPISASMSTMLWSKIWYRTPNGTTNSSTSVRSGSAAPEARSPSESKIDDRSVKFRSTGTYLRTKNLADALGNDPTQRDQYLKLMNAVLDTFNQQAQKAGLQNDLALALSYFLAENVRIYRGLPDLTDQQFVELRNSIAEVLVSTGALNSATDRQKQEFYEALVAYTGITQFGYEEGLKAQNDQITKAYQKVAGQNLQAVTKMSPDDINFGPSGVSTGDNLQASTGSPVSVSSGPVDIYQFRKDYSENEVRADQLYKGKRFVFTGLVTEVSKVHYITAGQDASGRYTYKDLGTNLKVANRGGTIIGWEVFCFFKDNNQLAQLSSQQVVTFEATVKGHMDNSNNLYLVDAVIR